LVAIGSMTGVLVVFFMVMVGAIVRARRKRVTTGREGLIGATGQVRRELDPQTEGLVFVQGELWKALAATDHINVGEQVVVENVSGLILTVRRASDVIPAPPRPPSPVAAKAGLLSRLW
jgi:membrane-bound serine protease (ClpP class)